MISTIFPYNSVLHSMYYENEILSLRFKKTFSIRKYRCEQKEIAYEIFYSKTALQCLNIFNEKIKNKLKVIEVIENGKTSKKS